MDRARAKARRAYRWGLLPLALLLIVGGVLGLVSAIAWRVGFVPFVHDETMARLLAGALGVGSAVIGVGLLYRSWAALWAVLVYNAFGHLWFALGCLLDPGLDKELDRMTLVSLYPPEMLASMRYILFGVLLAFGIGFTIGIYFALKPVYRAEGVPDDPVAA